MGGLLVTDRMLKIFAIKGLLPKWSFFGYWPRFTFHENHGLAFDLPVSQAVITTLSIIIIILLVALLVRTLKKNPTLTAALLFVISGAVSNLYDRLRFGFVIDWLELFPRSIWNLADVMILAGILLFVIPNAVEGSREIPSLRSK